jgi:Sigma-54 interaction domain
MSGETGTGKDLMAAAIHKRSKCNRFPYLPVNMGAIPSELIAVELFGHEKVAYTGASETRTGLFEQAQGGTFSSTNSTRWMRRPRSACRGDRDIPVNVRVIAPTDENIEQAVKTGRFHEDLYYRLDVFRIQLPPLRERPARCFVGQRRRADPDLLPQRVRDADASAPRVYERFEFSEGRIKTGTACRSFSLKGRISPLRKRAWKGLTESGLAAADGGTEWRRLKSFFFEYHCVPDGCDISFDLVWLKTLDNHYPTIALLDVKAGIR